MFDWITSLVEQTGYLGIALLMFLENVFPPIPSELIMPLAGFSAARGEFDVALVIAAGTAGSLASTLIWYYLGALVGAERLKRWSTRYGRWLTLTPEEVDRASAWFARHGGAAVFFGRLLPAVRTLISVPAGMSGMSLTAFLLYSALGTALWTAFLAGAGYLLEAQYERVAAWVNPVSNVVVLALVLGYLWRVATFRRRVGPPVEEPEG